MRYTRKEDIYVNAKVGMKICYATNASNYINGKLKTGFITKIIPCNQYDETHNPCNIRIYIDNLPKHTSGCFMFHHNFCTIKWIEGEDFFNEKEFEI